MSSLPVPEAGGRLGVLVVDDDSQLLRTLADILRRRGYEPSTATTGQEGLAVAARIRPAPAIALVDLALPDMNGLDLVHQLRRVSGFTEVVILTGNASLDSALGALRQQSCDYLIKPVPPERLMDTLGRAGERWRRRCAEAALVHSEERLRILVENISDVVLLLGADGRISYASPSLEATLGYTLDFLRGSSVTDLVHERDQALAHRLVDFPAGEAVEIRLRRSDGRWGRFSCRTANLVGQPAASGLVLIAQDVTERRRLEAQVLHAQKLDSIGHLAGGVAHDFNNLLSVVMGCSDLALLRQDLDEELRGLLVSIYDAGERGASLTRQLLAFSRRQPTEPVLLDPNHLVRSMEGLLRRTLGEDVDLVCDLDPRVGAIRIDPAQMEQVLMNLAVNAREAMPHGGRLWLSTRAVSVVPREAGAAEGAEGFVRLRVIDTGLGMSEEVLEQLFEPFFSTKEMGTGLGLATTYGIVRQAGGRILAASVLGEGSTFSLYFPLAEGEVRREDEPTLDLSDLRGDETVLVVEDETAVRDLVGGVLESRGYRVIKAHNGEEALDLVRGSGIRPALLLTDVVMPGMSGHEIARRLRGEISGLRVVLMSGYSGLERGVGADGLRLLNKPFSLEALARAVRGALDAPPSGAC